MNIIGLITCGIWAVWFIWIIIRALYGMYIDEGRGESGYSGEVIPVGNCGVWVDNIMIAVIVIMFISLFII